MSSRFVMPFALWVDEIGQPLAGGQLFFYVSGTSTPQDTFSDAALTIANANPVVANAAGVWPDIFLTAGNYKVVLEDVDNVQIWTADPVSAELAAVPYDIQFAVSDETTPITTGTAVITFRIPRAFTLDDVRAGLSTAGSADSIFDVKLGGASIFTTDLLSVDAGETTSKTAATPPNVTTTAMPDDGVITVDITAAGTGATGVKIALIGHTS